MHCLRLQFLFEGNLVHLDRCRKECKLLWTHTRQRQAQILQEGREGLTQGTGALAVRAVVEQIKLAAFSKVLIEDEIPAGLAFPHQFWKIGTGLLFHKHNVSWQQLAEGLRCTQFVHYTVGDGRGLIPALQERRHHNEQGHDQWGDEQSDDKLFVG